MRPEVYMDRKTINHLYGDQREADRDPADGVIVACSIGLWLWFIGYYTWVEIVAPMLEFLQQVTG